MALSVIGSATALCPDLKMPLFLQPASCGFPSPTDDFLEGSLDLNTFLIKHPAATFFVRTKGDSMKNAGIQDGDLLLVDRAIEPVDGDIVIAVINGELTVKRLCTMQGRPFLMAENKGYPPIPIKEEMELMVWGTVLHVIHSTRKR